MSKPKVTPWFNCQKQPPVREGTYEVLCSGPTGPYAHVAPRWTGSEWRDEPFGFIPCPQCRWRGLTKPGERNG